MILRVTIDVRMMREELRAIADAYRKEHDDADLGTDEAVTAGVLVEVFGLHFSVWRKGMQPEKLAAELIQRVLSIESNGETLP